MGFDPVTGAAVFGGASLLQSGLGLASERRGTEHQFRQFREQRALALASFAEAAGGVRARTQEGREQIMEEVRSLFQEGVRLRGQATTAAAEAGVAGRSVSEVQLDLARAESGNRGRLTRLQELRELQAERDLRALALSTEARLRAAQPAPGRDPTTFLLGSGLSALTAGFQGFALFNDLSVPGTSNP